MPRFLHGGAQSDHAAAVRLLEGNCNWRDCGTHNKHSGGTIRWHKPNPELISFRPGSSGLQSRHFGAGQCPPTSQVGQIRPTKLRRQQVKAPPPSETMSKPLAQGALRSRFGAQKGPPSRLDGEVARHRAPSLSRKEVLSNPAKPAKPYRITLSFPISFILCETRRSVDECKVGRAIMDCGDSASLRAGECSLHEGRLTIRSGICQHFANSWLGFERASQLHVR